MTRDELLEWWETFVAEVEEGFDDDIDEYWYALHLRDAIAQEAGSAAPDPSEVRRLALADERFLRATYPVEHPLTSAGPPAATRHLHGRMPTKLVGRLRTDCAGFGIPGPPGPPTGTDGES